MQAPKNRQRRSGSEAPVVGAEVGEAATKKHGKRKKSAAAAAKPTTEPTTVPAAARVNGAPPEDDSEREAMFNLGERGPARLISKPVVQVAAIRGFMIDIDVDVLDPAVVGEQCVADAEQLYERHVRIWLDREPVLFKSEVRFTGGGLHVLLWLDEPIICVGEDAQRWDKIALGLRSVLPADPRGPGLNVMTRPVGALNLKYSPPRVVRVLRHGSPVSKAEVLQLFSRVANAPAVLWMQVLHGDERVSPCPLCAHPDRSLGVAGSWHVQCYKCGRVNASQLMYRLYSAEFLKTRKDSANG